MERIIKMRQRKKVSKYKIEPGYEAGLVLYKDGEMIAFQIGGPYGCGGYVHLLKKRLERGEKLNWWTRLKSNFC